MATVLADTPPEPIVSTREFPVSRAELYAAYSDPAQLRQWWGPKGFTNTFHEFDLREGGRWRFTMHGPDGKDYPNNKAFTVVRPAECITFEHLEPMHIFTMTLLFEDAGDQARMTWRMQFHSPVNDNLRNFIHGANEENFDRLEAHLQSKN